MSVENVNNEDMNNEDMNNEDMNNEDMDNEDVNNEDVNNGLNNSNISGNNIPDEWDTGLINGDLGNSNKKDKESDNKNEAHLEEKKELEELLEEEKAIINAHKKVDDYDVELEEALEEELEDIREEIEEEKFFKEDKRPWPLLIIPATFIVLAVLIFGVMSLTKNKTFNPPEEVKNETESPVNTKEDINNDNEIEVMEESPESKESIEEIINNEELPPLPQAVPIMETDVIDYSSVDYDIAFNLKEMEEAFITNNMEALYDLSHLDRFIAMSYEYRDTTDYAYFGDVNENGEPHGNGTAVYADNQYYSGQWENGKRSGSGMWIHFHIHLKDSEDIIKFHEYIGEFKNDLPEGQGQDYYEYDITRLKPNKYYITNYIGEFKEGLINNKIYCTAVDYMNNYSDFEGRASMGTFEYLSESRDKQGGGPVMYAIENPDSYYWITPYDNRNIGVTSYISANKK